MLILTGAADLVQVVTGSSATVEVHASYVDNNAGAITPNRTNTAVISTATTTTVVGSPGASIQRNLKHLSIYNDHASTATTLAVQHTDGTNVETMWEGTLAAQESVIFDQVGRWTHYDAVGTPLAPTYPVATQADMESGTSLVTFVPPGRMHYHLGVAKCVLKCGITANTLGTARNIASLTDTGVGRVTVTIDVDFADANWICSVSNEGESTTLTAAGSVNTPYVRTATQAVGSVELNSRDATTTTNALNDPAAWHMLGHGDMA